MDDSVIDALMAERIERVGPTSVDAASVEAWCSFFGEVRERHAVTADGWVVPPAMLATFGRPLVDPGDGSTQLELHDRLKAELSLPVAIAVGYELECHAMVGEDDRLHSVERISSVGELRRTRFGPGRDWVIEVASVNRSGDLVCIERWSMLGYDPEAPSPPATPGASGASSASTPTSMDEATSSWTSTIAVSHDLVIGGATVNRVWARGHHEDAAAVAAGLPGIIVDTSTWVSLTAIHAAQWLGGDARPGSIALTMKRPVVVGDVIELSGDIVGDVVDGVGVRWITVDVVGRVRDRIVVTAVVRLAVITADGTDVWTLDADRWHPASQ